MEVEVCEHVAAANAEELESAKVRISELEAENRFLKTLVIKYIGENVVIKENTPKIHEHLLRIEGFLQNLTNAFAISPHHSDWDECPTSLREWFDNAFNQGSGKNG